MEENLTKTRLRKILLVIGESLVAVLWVSILSSACQKARLKTNADFIFSPDVKYVAAISEDGCLRLIDALAEQYEVQYELLHNV